MKRPWFIIIQDVSRECLELGGDGIGWTCREEGGRKAQRHREGTGAGGGVSLFESVGLVSHRPGPAGQTTAGGGRAFGGPW